LRGEANHLQKAARITEPNAAENDYPKWALAELRLFIDEALSRIGQRSISSIGAGPRAQPMPEIDFGSISTIMRTSPGCP
jgi:hypothetical protein